ncbi:hypothetical protein H5410_034003, partial [Solanum commersonii]
ELVKEPKIEEMEDEKTEELKQHSPLILCIDLHCLGCAKKIERTISKIRGFYPTLVTLLVNRLTTVELIVNMHCEACAKQLKRKILKMRGSMDANKLVDYVYRRTKKQAKIVLQHEPRKHKEETKSEDPNPDEEAKKLEEEDKKEGGRQ